MPKSEFAWIVRLAGRVLTYTFLGALACGLAGGALGMIVGAHLWSYAGMIVGWRVGLRYGADLGAILFFLAAFQSEPDSFWKTFQRMWAFSVAGMVIGVAAGTATVGIVAAIASEFKFNPTLPFSNGWSLLEYLELNISAPVLMVFGQFIGGLLALRKQAGTQAQFFSTHLPRLCITGAVIGYGLPALAIVRDSLTSASQSGGISRSVDWMLPLAGAGAVTTAIIFATLMTCWLCFRFVPQTHWEDALKWSRTGMGYGLLLGGLCYLFTPGFLAQIYAITNSMTALTAAIAYEGSLHFLLIPIPALMVLNSGIAMLFFLMQRVKVPHSRTIELVEC